jgi:hypothetical protein
MEETLVFRYFCYLYLFFSSLVQGCWWLVVFYSRVFLRATLKENLS